MKQGNSLGDSPVRKDTYIKQEKRIIVRGGGEKSQDNLICGKRCRIHKKKKITKGVREIGSQRMPQHKELGVSQRKLESTISALLSTWFSIKWLHWPVSVAGSYLLQKPEKGG